MSNCGVLRGGDSIFSDEVGAFDRWDQHQHSDHTLAQLLHCVYKMFPELLSDSLKTRKRTVAIRKDISGQYVTKCKEHGGNTDETGQKRPRKDAELKARNQLDTGGAATGHADPEDAKAGTSGSTKGIATAARLEANADRSKNTLNAANNPVVPLVCHQIATRSSTGRLSKRLRSYSPPKSPPPAKKQAKDGSKAGTSNTKAASGTPETKPRKQWEQWSIQDKDLFFEALYEHGKDFEAIQNSISQKLKKRDPTSGVRTKDHIRHFYYRTWHKITKWIDPDGIDDVNKQALELYGLVNYGEIRKRVGKLDEKIGQKLNELVHKGVTVIRLKQKNHRIKTPSCRALKRLHHIEDHKEEERAKMPDRVSIELFPHTNTAWAQIQSLAQNPRLRVTLRISKRASSLIEFINKKWTSDRVRMKEELKETETSETEIKINIPEGTKLSPIQLKHTPVVPKLEFSFNSYVESMRGHQLNTSSPQQNKKMPPTCKNILSKLEEIQIQQPSTSGTDQSEPVGGVQDNQVSSTDEISAMSTETFGLLATSAMATSPDKAATKETISVAPRSPPKAVCGFESLYQYDDSAIPFSDALSDVVAPVADEMDTQPACRTEVEVKREPSVQELEAKDKQTRLEKGLLLSDCGNMTIAELYMMLGCPKRLCLEYDWVEKKTKEDIWELNKKLTNMLRRLVHLATTEFIDFKKVKPAPPPPVNKSPPKCMCGANRNNGTPPSNKQPNGRSPRVNSPAASRAKMSGRSPSTPGNSRRERPSTPSRDSMAMSVIAPTTPTSSKRQPRLLSPEMLMKPPEEPVSLGINNIGAGDGVFKLPTAMPPRAQQTRPNFPGNVDSVAEKNLIQQINMVQRRTGQRRLNRNVRRPLVVQRTLLPKAQAPARQIMTLAMVPGVSTPGQTASFLPVMSSNVLRPCSSIIQSSCTMTTTTASVNAVAVSQDFGAPQVVRTSKGTVTTMSLASMNRPTAIRRIIPTPVTTVSEDSSVFVEAPELGATNNNLLKEAAMAADIPDPSTPSQGVAVRRSGDLHTPPHGQMDFTSRPGATPLDTPDAFSQAFTLTSIDPILSASSVSRNLTNTNTIGEIMPSKSLVLEPPNISTLLDISVPSVDMNDSTDKLLDLSLMNSNSSFGGLAGDKDASLSSLLNPSDDAAVLSPNKGFKGIAGLPVEEQWLGPGDLSMSSFLQDTPVKKPTADTSVLASTSGIRLTNRHSSEHGHQLPIHAQPFVMGEGSRDSMIFGNVETTFEVMMNENSMDYMSKFADLAAHINGSHQEVLTLRKQTELLEEKAS